jgi:hypothetical protein
MGRIRTIGVVAALAVVAAWGGAARAEGPAPLGAVVAVTGTVEVGVNGVWKPAAAATSLFDGQVLRTAAASGVEVLFDGEVPARIGEKTEIAVADLMLKARLEKARAGIAAPVDATKAEMQVTPLTGVRGTEKTEEKAGDLKRDHFWNESAPAAK